MAKNTTIVEINGIKMEVDLRSARRVDEFRVGDRVKVLVKEYSSTEIYHGVIVAFEQFQSLPTIVVSYVTNSYNPEIRLAYLNSKTMSGDDKKFEIVPDIDETLPFAKADVIRSFNRQIEIKMNEINDILQKKGYFLARFGAMFKESPAFIEQQRKEVQEEQAKIQTEIAEKVANV
jgi:hypothetical protein